VPLKLSLKPGEKFVLNGAVVQNGDRRGVLVLQKKGPPPPGRGNRIQDPGTTPARRIYFPVMMMYLEEGVAEKFYEEFATRLNDFMGVVRNPAVLQDCIAVSKH